MYVFRWLAQHNGYLRDSVLKLNDHNAVNENVIHLLVCILSLSVNSIRSINNTKKIKVYCDPFKKRFRFFNVRYMEGLSESVEHFL